ncbi:MAG: hypothetical protein ABF289_05350 [Clostridiales bacterium]
MKLSMNQKNKKAIRMFNSGMKKGTICKQLHLSLDLLNRWIIKNKKDIAINMYLKGNSIQLISSTLKTKNIIVNFWINEYIQIPKNINLIYKLDGKSPWIDQITNTR